MRPGSLEHIQQGISEVLDELSYRLAGHVNEKDLESNLERYEVAKLECEQQLQEPAMSSEKAKCDNIYSIHESKPIRNALK